MYASKLATGISRSQPWLRLTMCRWPPPAATQRRVASITCSGVPVRSSVFVHISLKHQLRILPSRLGQIVADAEADHVGAAGGHQVQIRAFLHEQDARHARDASENALVIWLCPVPVFLEVQHSGPGIEELVDVRAVRRPACLESGPSRSSAARAMRPTRAAVPWTNRRVAARSLPVPMQ